MAYDASVSFQELQVEHPANARQDEYLELIGHYERLRLSDYFSEPVKKRLKTEKADFRLVQADEGRWRFAPTDYAAHAATGVADPQISSSQEQVKVGDFSGKYVAENLGQSRQGAWACAAKTFDHPLNLEKHGALGVWINGDGKGELLNVQLTNPPQYGKTRDEHYVKIDFTGWRYFELLLRERDAEQHGDFVWPYGTASIYEALTVFRLPLLRTQTGGVNLYYNNLPPQNRATCFLSPIKALPIVKTHVVNPTITVGTQRIVFPLTIESGASIEFDSPSDCKVYDERGVLMRELKLPQTVPILAAGPNELSFTCESPGGVSPRAKVTVITMGEPFGNDTEAP